MTATDLSVDMNDDDDSCWTTVSSIGEECGVVTTIANSYDSSSSTFPRRKWNWAIVFTIVGLAVLYIYVNIKYLWLYDVPAVVIPLIAQSTENVTAMPTLRLTLPSQLASATLPNRNLTISINSSSSLCALFGDTSFVPQGTFKRAMGVFHNDRATLYSMQDAVFKGVIALVTNVEHNVRELIYNTNADPERQLDSEVGVNTNNARLDIALTFCLIMLGVHLQYKYG